MPTKKTLSVAAIENGTVIDHIRAGNAIKIIRILDLAGDDRQVTVGLNLTSKSRGIKDIIKASGRDLTKKEAESIAILAPEATVNIIKNFDVTLKFPIDIPERVENIIVCPNPMCITNHESMTTIFGIIKKNEHLTLKCHYCERRYEQIEIRSYKN
jgi:aspartate carbamoyltransferase regulatory subunit